MKPKKYWVMKTIRINQLQTLCQNFFGLIVPTHKIDIFQDEVIGYSAFAPV